MTVKNKETRKRQSALERFEKLEDSPFFLSMQRGLVLVLPLVMTGSLALLLRDFPLPALQELLDAVFGQSWRMTCESLILGSFGISSLAILCAFSGAMAALHNQRFADPFVSPIIAVVVVLSCFFVVTSPAETVSWRVLFSMDRGLLVALIVAATGGKLFLFLARIGPLQFPLVAVGNDPVVRDVLTVMPAGIVTIIVFGIIRQILVTSGFTELHGALRDLVSIPFLGRSDELGLGLTYAGLSQLFWFFGAHGPNLLFSIEENIMVPAGLANSIAVAAGAVPPFVFTKPFVDVFTRMGGSGCTLCLIIAVLFKSRDKSNIKLCMLSLLPALCNVNEPLLFGIPIVLNPIYVLPFILSPIAQFVAAYYATLLGLIPHTVVETPWTAPALFSGFVATGSLSGASMQFFNLLLGAAIYLPFVRLSDHLRERQGTRMLDALMHTSTSCETGPAGRKCLDRPGAEGRLARALANDLNRALTHNEQFFLEYQPQIDIPGNCVHGVEALLRWRHPTYGLIPPSLAVALAEDIGCIHQLGLFVLTQACVQRVAWMGRVPDGLTISVNVTPHQLLAPLFAQKILDVLEKSGMLPDLLVVEITESLVLEPDACTVATLRRLRESGVRVAIDDFGMGHASLRYLREFPVDTVKIDRSLTLASPGDVNDNIVRSIVDLSRTLGIMTVVEGVELPKQLVRLINLGCGTFQGFLFSRPVSGEDCLAFILDQSIAQDNR